MRKHAGPDRAGNLWPVQVSACFCSLFYSEEKYLLSWQVSDERTEEFISSLFKARIIKKLAISGRWRVHIFCADFSPIFKEAGYTMWALLFFTLDAGLLARSQYSEVPATGHLNTGFSWFPCVYKQMLRWFPRFQVATTCLSCSPPDLNLVVTNFIFCIHVK